MIKIFIYIIHRPTDPPGAAREMRIYTHVEVAV